MRTMVAPSSALALVCVAAFVVSGCTQSEGHHGIDPIPGKVLAGSVELVPSLEGSWRLTNDVTSDTCGAFSDLFPDVAVVEIRQFGTSLTFELFGPCGTLLFEGTGTIDAAGMVTIAFDHPLALDKACTLRLKGSRTGLVNDAEDLVTGSHVLEVTAIGDCGAGLPCEIKGTFLARRCPPANCRFSACGP